MTGPLEGESREPAAGSRQPAAGSREAREIRMFNHWAAGLRSGLLPEDCGVATPKSAKKTPPQNVEVCKRVLIFGYKD